MASRRPPSGKFVDDDAYFNEPDAAADRSRRSAGVPSAGADEVDPLDAFMAEIDQEVAKGAKKQKPKAGWEDLEAEDGAVSYLEAFAQGKVKKRPDLDDDEAALEEDDDEDGDRRKKPIEPLPTIDHTLMKYNSVRTDFTVPHPEIVSMTEEQLQSLRRELRISATGANVARPVASFAHLAPALGKELMAGIRAHGYSQPTAIQAQAIPVALQGRDVIGVAETGSGKTVAYLLPMLVHAAAQPELQKDEGPIGLVLCPTRELAVQIESEVFKFNKRLGLRSVTLAGGLSKLEQFKEIKRGCEIVIGNPGRLIDIVKMKGCNLHRCTFIVLDEADRMMHLGFEYQVRSIAQNVRPSRQTLLFSATFPPKIEKLARDLLQQPVRVTIGEGGQAAANITQTVVVLKNDDEKWAWLSKNVDGMLIKGQVLVFVKSIASAEELTQNFTDFLEKKSVFLHGDMDQTERMKILGAFRKQRVMVMIATDVAARGLDITTIGTVVSFDVARDIETHTHRIGRTGRAGAAGDAYTLITSSNEESKKMAALLAESLEQANQNVSEDLKVLAMKYGPYRAAKLQGKQFEGKKKKGQGQSVQSVFGLGFDGQAIQKETAKDLEKRLNNEADKLAAANRRIMMGAQRGGNRAGVVAASRSLGGFVAASTEESAPAKKVARVSKDDSSSDDDLFAPGVTGAFGKGKPQFPPEPPKRLPPRFS